jgi:hypothetical protein
MTDATHVQVKASLACRLRRRSQRQTDPYFRTREQSTLMQRQHDNYSIRSTARYTAYEPGLNQPHSEHGTGWWRHLGPGS